MTSSTAPAFTVHSHLSLLRGTVIFFLCAALGAGFIAHASAPAPGVGSTASSQAASQGT